MSKLNYIFLAVVVVLAFLIATNQEALGQEILILANGIAVATQVIPLLLGTFWKKATAGGVVLASVTGLVTYGIASFCGSSAWYQIYLFGAHPVIPTLVVTLIMTIAGSLLTPGLRVPLGVYKVWFCKDYPEEYTTVYDSLSRK